MGRNKLYTCSYFSKRLVDSGFDVDKLDIKYQANDPRKWTLVVNKQKSKKKMNIVITCFKDEQTKQFAFKFQGQRKKQFLLQTMTMTMIIDILKRVQDQSQEAKDE